MRSDPRLLDFSAAGLSAGLALFELIRLIASRGASPGYTVLSSLIGGGLFIGVLALAAVGLVLHRQVGWSAGVGGVLAATGHGIVVRAGGSWAGALYIFAGLALFVLLVKDLRTYRSPLVAR